MTKAKKIIIFSILCIIIGAGLWYLINTNYHHQGNQIYNATTTQTTKEPVSIEYQDNPNLLNVEMYKNEYNLTEIGYGGRNGTNDFYIKPYKIGIILNDQYKDKIIALVNYELNDDLKNQQHYTSNHSDSYYAFVIAEPDGKPIAWDDVYTSGFTLQGSNAALYNITTEKLDFLPKEFVFDSWYRSTIYTQDHKGQFTHSRLSNEKVNSDDIVGYSESHFPIKRVRNGFFNNAYYVEFPFGKNESLSLKPDFMKPLNAEGLDERIPLVYWSTGTTSVSKYEYGRYGFDWQACFSKFTDDSLASILIQTGKNSNGYPIYEMDQNKAPSIYQCLYKLRVPRYTGHGIKEPDYSYSEFIEIHPIFFWKHPIGDYVAFINIDFLPESQ